MTYIFFSNNVIEPWSFENPDKQGIGGSETSHIELCWRLARRGHEVISYAPVPWEGEREWRGTTWTHFKNANYTLPGTWLVYRAPDVLDNFPAKHPRQKLIHVNQDTYYHTASEKRYSKLDHLICLCRDHAKDQLKTFPCLKDKLVISRNGLRGDLVDEVLAEGIPRNPRKIIYASSPDRGMKEAVAVVDRAREYIQDLELHTYYGLDNYKSMADNKGEGFEARAYWSKRAVEGFEKFMANYPWVIQHGRVPQRVMYREWASASIFLYPTSFTETGCITNMEAQALGAIPITNPIWALRDYTLHGMLIQGNPTEDLLVRQRYTSELLRLMGDAGLKFQDTFRPQMMKEAREQFDWEIVAAQIEEISAPHQGEVSDLVEAVAAC